MPEPSKKPIDLADLAVCLVEAMDDIGAGFTKLVARRDDESLVSVVVGVKGARVAEFLELIETFEADDDDDSE